MLKNLRVATTSRVLVLCAVIAAQNYLPTELSSPFIVLLGFSIMILSKIQRSYFRLVWPLLVVLATEFIGISGHESRDIFRDIAYALMPISLIFMGYWMVGTRRMWPIFLKVMVMCSFVISLIHLSAFAQNPELLINESMDVRKTVGGTGDLVILVLVLGLLQQRLGINDLFPKLAPRFIVIPMLLASIILSYSRTNYLVGIILSLSLLGLVSQLSHRFILSIAAIMVSFTILVVVTPKDEEGTFRGKIVNSISEIMVSDYQDMAGINKNWRGFEAQKAVDTFLSGNIQQQVFGQGLGALVDLGFFIPLGGEGDVIFRYIPVIHNGYAYILVKAGLLGLFCYALFYISIIRYTVRNSHTTNSEQIFLVRLMMGCILSLAFSMLVVGGMAEAHNAELLLLLGYLARRIWIFQVEASDLAPRMNTYEK